MIYSQVRYYKRKVRYYFYETKLYSVCHHLDIHWSLLNARKAIERSNTENQCVRCEVTMTNY